MSHLSTCRRLAFAWVSAALLLGSSRPSAASLPDPRFSEVEPLLVGCPSGHAVPGCDRPMGSVAGFQVLVRSVNNSPLQGRTVTLDFSATSMRLFGDTRSGTTVNCAAATISRLTDQAGEVTFEPRVGGSTAGAKIVVDANGVILAEVSGRSTDFDGDGRTDLFDAGLLAANLLGGSLDTRTDLDGCSVGGPTSLRDFAIFAAEFLRVNPDLPCR